MCILNFLLVVVSGGGGEGGGGHGAAEPPTKFSKKGGSLTGTQVLEGGCWKRGSDFFQECCNF